MEAFILLKTRDKSGTKQQLCQVKGSKAFLLLVFLEQKAVKWATKFGNNFLIENGNRKNILLKNSILNVCNKAVSFLRHLGMANCL